MSRHRRTFTVLPAIVALAGLLGGALAGCGSSAGATPMGYQHYVALGDSYASGPLIPNQIPNPIGCGRSDHNYPSDLARSLRIPTFVDVTCGGATTADMTETQKVPLGSAAPQFNALTANTDLVTVTLGGNDIDFMSIIETCAERSALAPKGNPCQQHYTTTGTDQLVTAVNAAAPKVAAVLAGIRQRAPHTTVVVVGYLRILPPTGGCWPRVPIAAGDDAYLTTIEQDLNAMLAAQAAKAGDRFVNPGTPTGHDACEPKANQWVVGVVPSSVSFPVHPNAAGMTEVATLIKAAIPANH